MIYDIRYIRATVIHKPLTVRTRSRARVRVRRDIYVMREQGLGLVIKRVNGNHPPLTVRTRSIKIPLLKSLGSVRAFISTCFGFFFPGPKAAALTSLSREPKADSVGMMRGRSSSGA